MKETERIQVTIIEDGKKTFHWLKKGSSLLELWNKKEDSFFSGCGGIGLCGKCRVRFLKGLTLPLHGDRIVFTPEELRKGFRLACLAKPTKACQIEVHFQKEKGINIVTEVSSINQNQKRMEQAAKSVGLKDYEDYKEDTVIVIDLGTTTIAMELKGIRTNQIYDMFCRINPQRRYGADVISRIQAANQENKEILERIVRKSLEQGISQFLKTAEDKNLCKPNEAYLSGNTPMVQLFMGHSVEKLGRYPFQPENIGRQETSLLGIKTIVMPGISAFVGGDIVSGLYYVKEQGGFYDEKAMLFIDLGTNGEMAIGNDRRILVTATAAGPAFEGGSGETIMGADLIECLDELKKQGLLDETGLLKEPWFDLGVPVGKAVLKGKDVRALQMAKAAIFAGISILIDQYGLQIEDIDRVYLAGGFGYYLNVKSAVAIGLIPSELSDRVFAVGNTSLAGAFLYGKNCMENGKKEKNAPDELEKLIEKCENLNLAEEEQFQRLYIKSMELKPLGYREIKKQLEQERERE